MKKTLCIILLIGVGFQATMAKESESKNKKEKQEQITPRRSDRKIIELKKVITISPTQEETIRNAYEVYCEKSDSILYEVEDGLTAARLTRQNKKAYDETFMKALTEYQRNTYIRITSTPEVEEKAAAKVVVLKESGDYTQVQLDSAQSSIFNYLMLEKVVYKRDKYDYRKQKENILQLKKLRPKQMYQADAQEKARIQKETLSRTHTMVGRRMRDEKYFTKNNRNVVVASNGGVLVFSNRFN